MNTFRRLYASQWLATTSAFISPKLWERREKALSKAKKRKRVPAYIGVDLSLKRDLTSAAIVWDFGKRWEAEVVSWTPANSIQQLVEAGQIRQQWVAADGPIRICPGSTIRFADIARWLAEMHRKFDVRGVAFDPSRFSEIERELRRLGVPFSRERDTGCLFLVPHSQQGKPPKGASEEYQDIPRLWLGRSLEALETAVLDGTIRYEANETLRAANEGCRITEDRWGYRHPDKSASEWKIDPIIALMMGCGFASWARIHESGEVDWGALDDLADAWV